MKSLFVSIVDVMGIFIPGFLLLVGIVLFPAAISHSASYKALWDALPDTIRTNTTGIGIILIIICYATGFVIRLGAIGLLHRLTKRWWASKLTKQSEILSILVEDCLNYPELCVALKEVYGTSNTGHVAGYAPYFNFAKRIVRHGNTSLWADAERLEAEIRFSAGLFAPMCLLTLDGILLIRSSPFGWMLTVFALTSSFVILYTFPLRRIREVLHVYTMAIITLRYKPESPPIKVEAKEGD